MEVNNSSQINLDYLNATFGNNQMVIQKILNNFLKNTPQLIQCLSDNIDAINWAEIKMIAHKTKTSYTTVGATVVAQKLAEIELNASLENKMSILPLINEIKLLNELVCSEIIEVLEK